MAGFFVRDASDQIEAIERAVRLNAVHAAHAGDLPRGHRSGPRQIEEHEGFVPAETHPLEGFRGLGQFHLPEDVNPALLTTLLHSPRSSARLRFSRGPSSRVGCIHQES